MTNSICLCTYWTQCKWMKATETKNKLCRSVCVWKVAARKRFFFSVLVFCKLLALWTYTKHYWIEYILCRVYFESTGMFTLMTMTMLYSKWLRVRYSIHCCWFCFVVAAFRFIFIRFYNSIWSVSITGLLWVVSLISSAGRCVAIV